MAEAKKPTITPFDQVLVQTKAFDERKRQRKRNPEGGRQIAAARREIRKIYSEGVPDTVSTKTVQAKLENKYSWDTVARALYRRRD